MKVPNLTTGQPGNSLSSLSYSKDEYQANKQNLESTIPDSQFNNSLLYTAKLTVNYNTQTIYEEQFPKI